MSDSLEVDQKVATDENSEIEDIELSASGCPGLEVCEGSSEGSEKDDLSPTESENKILVSQEINDTEKESHETPINMEIAAAAEMKPEIDKLALSEDATSNEPPIASEKPKIRESKRNSGSSRKIEPEENERENEISEKRLSRTEGISKRSTRSIASAAVNDSELSIGSPSIPANKTPVLGVALSKRSRSTAGATPSYQDLHSLGRNEEKDDEADASPKESGRDKCYQTRPPTLIAHNKDYYCWICHQSEDLHACNSCFRVYHAKCLKADPESAPFEIDLQKPNWECFECLSAEKCARTSRCSTWLSIENLGMCLQKVVSRLANTPSFDLFSEAVDKNEYPDYTKFIYKPMNLAKMDKKAMTLQYSCGETLRQDCKLFFHNSSIFNGPISPITAAAKRMLGACDKELAQIEACPDCYCNSLLRSDFFEIPCRIPHPLIWAKFGSYPYWPSKVFAVLSSSKKLDCRFFGAHDRANVPFNSVYKYSKDPPEPVTKHLKKFEAAYAEAERYVKKLQTYQNFKLAANRTKYVAPAQGEAFGEIQQKIAADLIKQNEDSESVSPQIMKQIDVGTSSSGKSDSRGRKKSKKDGHVIVSTDDLSSDSESDSDSETLLAKLSSGQKSSKSTPTFDTTKTLPLNGSKLEGKKSIGNKLTATNQNSSSRSKRALGMSFVSHTDENANMTPIPPSKKPRNETPIPSNISLDSRHKLKLELNNKKELVTNSPFSEKAEEDKATKEKEKREGNASYVKTRSRRSTSPSKNTETLKKVKESSQEKDITIEEEFVEDSTPTDESNDVLENLVTAKESKTETSNEEIPPEIEINQAQKADETERNAGLFNNLSENMDTSPVPEEKPSPICSPADHTDVGSNDVEAKMDEESYIDPLQTSDAESELKKELVEVSEEKLEAMDCAPVQEDRLVPSVADKPKSEITLADNELRTPSIKVESTHRQSEQQNLSTNSKKPALEAVLSELEETGRGKRTKFKSTLYNSDEEVDPTKFTKSASKKAKESNTNGSSLAATLQAKRMASQTPKVESNSSLSPSAKSSSPTFQRSISHGSPAVKPVILSESNKMHSKPKGVVKGTPQPTPPKTLPGPSSEDALVDKVTERLSGSLGELVKQVLEAQSRGDSLSREDILNAIMNRTSLPPNKTGSIATAALPHHLTPVVDTFSPSMAPIRKKVETRDSPAQVDIPNEIAATQRAELRKLISEKKAALDERQKLIDEIAAWQRKVKNIKEAEVERKEAQTNKFRQEFSAKVDEFKREKSLQFNDLTRHYELLIAEIETNMTCMHREEVRKLKEQHGNDLKDIKRKQWCAYCFKESQYHCCWNTSYCDYRCQQKHWSEHMKTCTQKSRNSAKKAASSSQSSSSENSKGRPSPMPSPSASPASTTSSSLPMTMFTPTSGVTGASNASAVSGNNTISVGMAAAPGGAHIQTSGIPSNPQLQPVGGGIAPNTIPGGAHIVTLPPGTLPPPGSVPMMFNPSVQQPPNVLPFTPAMMQITPSSVSVMPGTSMGAP